MRLALALPAVLLPRLAAACPSCAGNEGFDGTRLLILGSFVLLPFAVAGAVAWIVVRRERARTPPDHHPL
jgi:hypothetical protein